MQFQPLPFMSNEKQIKYFTDMVDKHKSKGIKLITQSIKEEKYEKYNFIKQETEIEYQSMNRTLNQVLISDGKSTLLFLGIGYEEINNLKSIFRKTIETIKLK